MSDLDPEDEKLLTLARATLRRLGGDSAAAVRDDTGRTYLSGPVLLPSLQLSALQAVVAVAMGSGATGLEAALLVTAEGTVADEPGVAAVRDLGSLDTSVFVAGLDGPATRT
jgi:hypothetical protein